MTTNDMDAINSPILFDGFKQGRQDSLKKIYDIMCRPLINYCEGKLRLGGVFDIPLSEDIVANSLYRLFVHRAQIKNSEHLKSFLYVACKNQLIDYLRGIKYKNQYIKYCKYTIRSEQRDEEVMEYELDIKNKLQWIKKAIKGLPRVRKAIIQFYFIEQKTTREIAEIMCLDPQTVLNHKTVAINQIRSLKINKGWIKKKRFSKLIKCIETGEIYAGIAEVTEKLGISKTTICQLIKESRTCRALPNHHFEFVNTK